MSHCHCQGLHTYSRQGASLVAQHRWQRKHPSLPHHRHQPGRAPRHNSAQRISPCCSSSRSSQDWPAQSRSELPACAQSAAPAKPHLKLIAAALAACLLLAYPVALTPPVYAETEDNLNNIPTQLQSAGEDGSQRLSSLLSGEKKGQVEGCVRKCVPTCVRGGGNGGAPGLGPISLRREIVVFKDGFRSRNYCLSECANVCSLSINGPSAATTAAAAR